MYVYVDKHEKILYMKTMNLVPLTKRNFIEQARKRLTTCEIKTLAYYAVVYITNKDDLSEAQYIYGTRNIAQAEFHMLNKTYGYYEKEIIDEMWLEAMKCVKKNPNLKYIITGNKP
jgi:hypothetical protein